MKRGPCDEYDGGIKKELKGNEKAAPNPLKPTKKVRKRNRLQITTQSRNAHPLGNPAVGVDLGGGRGHIGQGQKGGMKKRGGQTSIPLKLSL